MDPSQPISSTNQVEEKVFSLTLNGLDQKVLMVSTHSTLSTPEETLAPKSHQVYHSTETPPIHMSLSTKSFVSSNNDNNHHTPHYQSTENGDDVASTMTPPDTPSFPSLIPLKPDEGKMTAKSHRITTSTSTTTSDYEENDNNFSIIEPIHKKKSIRSRFKDALKIKPNRSVKILDLNASPSPATFSLSPSSSTPTPTLQQQSPFLDKRHSTSSSSLLDYSKTTHLQQKHNNKAKSWQPPCLHDNLNDVDQTSLSTKTCKVLPTVESLSSSSTASTLSGTFGPDLKTCKDEASTPLDDSPPMPTSRFLTAFQKLYHQKSSLDTTGSSSSRQKTKEEKHIPPPSATASLADKIMTRFKSNGTSSKHPATTSSSKPHLLESSSMAHSWSTFSQSFVPSCSVNYASRQKCGIPRTRSTHTSSKHPKVSTMFAQQKHNDSSKGQVFTRPETTVSSNHSQSTNNKRLSQQHQQNINTCSHTYSTPQDSPITTKLGHNKPSRLSAPPSSFRHQNGRNHLIPTSSYRASINNMSSPALRPSIITNTTSFATLFPTTSSNTKKVAHMDSNKPSLSSSSSFSTSSTASCSSTSYLSVSSTQSTKKANGLLTSPIPTNSSIPIKNKMTRSPRLDPVEKNHSVMRTKIAPNQNMTLLGDRLKRKKKKLRVRFLTMTTVQDTFSRHEYDRASDPYAVCTRLTASLAQQIKDELNTFKLEEMKVHSLSRCNTQFFL